MNESTRESLEERVQRLEASVEALREEIAALREEQAEPESGASASEASASPEERDGAPDGPSAMTRVVEQVQTTLTARTEDWLNRVGIALLLFGLAFLFKYSVDQGWLVPAVRVTFGAGLGAVLLLGGLRLPDRRTALRLVLLGGSSAALYTTVFAAHQLYALVPHAVAFACMTAITVGTFVVAVREEGVALGVIGALGGLGTPFLLDPGPGGSVPGLVGYTVLLLGGMTLVYVYRGWRSLLYTAAVGGWLVMIAVVAQVAYDAPTLDRWAVQGGLIGTWLLLGAVPVGRAWLHARAPDVWPQPNLPNVSWLRSLLRTPPAYALVGGSPLLAYGLTRALWSDVPDAAWVAVAGTGAVLYGIAFLALRSRSVSRYAPAHATVAAVLAAIAGAEGLDGSTLLVAWGVEVLALHAAARRLDAPVLQWSAHAGAALVAIVWADAVETVQADVLPMLHPAGLSEALVLGLVLAASWLVPSTVAQRVYRLAGLAGGLAWTWQEFAVWSTGDAYVTTVWGLVALALLVASARRRSVALSYAALATLALFVGKLFLVDLARLPALWRILLFLGFGAVFLALSRFVPGLWRPAVDLRD
jgi:uncharacterized membrane protein